MNEFEMIERYFLPLSMGRAEVAGFKDDAAVLDIPQGYELVVTSDTLNENVHFLAGESPENIACKALRVNLSDLAAMGADPLSYQLNIAFPKRPDDAWLYKFSNALLADNRRYNIFCSGGDTTSIKGDFLSISITALGLVPKGQAVRRGGAKNGDFIVITGAIGDAYLGLKTLQDGLDNKVYEGAVKRYLCPEPRMESAGIIRNYANSAVDISDGLLSDVLHLAQVSGLGVEINLEKLQFSKDVQHALDNNIVNIDEIIKGGDDYEIILSVDTNNKDTLIRELEKNKLNPMVIGVIKGKKLRIINNNATHRIDANTLGFQHF